MGFTAIAEPSGSVPPTTTNQMSDSKGENDLLKSSNFFISASLNVGNIARRV
jgi:hypothetical protein